MSNHYEFRFVDIGQDDWVGKLNGFGFDGFRVVASMADGRLSDGTKGSVIILQKDMKG